jgi:hypothetical protein
MSTNMWRGDWRGRNPVGDAHKRARRVISPSGGIVRGKFPSRKNGRMVHHEGLLELDAIYLFETSPQVVRFREQPTSIHYPDGAKLRRYTPDFELLLVNGTTVIIEVKPLRFLEQENVRQKFDRIEEHLVRSSTRYLILTDQRIRQEPRLSNLRWIYHQARRIPPTYHATQAALGKCCNHLPASFKTVRKLLIGTQVEPCSLLIGGSLRCSLDMPVTLDTTLNLCTEAENGWFWLAQEYGF